MNQGRYTWPLKYKDTKNYRRPLVNTGKLMPSAGLRIAPANWRVSPFEFVSAIINSGVLLKHKGTKTRRHRDFDLLRGFVPLRLRVS